MERFLNALKAQAAALDRAQGQLRFGVVVSVDPARYAARVSLQPEGVLSGWLPVLSPWVGAGWGLACLPSPGDQVLVLPQEGEAEHGVVVGACWSDSARAPGAPPGEIWLVHQSGSFIKLLSDGTVQVKCDLHVDGDVYDRRGSLARLRENYDAHVHADPQGGTTSAPSPQD
jgi:phage baseplate assembly protein V